MEALNMFSPCLWWSTRDDGTLLSVNAVLCRKTGFAAADLVGMKPAVLFPVATLIFQQTHLFPLLKMQGFAEEIFITLKMKDGNSLPVLLNAERTSVDGEARIHYAGIVVNQRQKFEHELIAARKTAEKALHENTALQAAQQEIRQHVEALNRQISETAQRHEELRQFNQAVTHNLQEPLRKSLLFLDRLKTELGPVTLAPSLQRLEAATAQLQAIVSGLQQYIWLTESPVAYEDIDVASTVHEIQEELNSHPEETRLQVEVEDIPQLKADRNQIRFLLHQLLSNARRFHKQGRHAHVRVSGTTLLLNKYRNLNGEFRWAEFARVDISDNGIGFDAAYNNQAFDLFRRLHPQSGLGIGLALCKKITDNHNGFIEIHPKTGIGTRVSFFIPLETGNEVDLFHARKNVNLTAQIDTYAP